MRKTIVCFLFLALILASCPLASAFRLIRYDPNETSGFPTEPHWWSIHDTLGQEWHNFSHWDLREFPECRIPWSAHDSTGDLPGLTEFDEVKKGFDSWVKVDPSVIRFIKKDIPSGALPPLNLDNNNMIGWGAGLDANTLGIASIWRVMSSGRILESDILFNDIHWWWKIGPHNIANDTADVQSIAVHEIGHFIGIHHTEINGGAATCPTMWRAVNPFDGTIHQRSLEQDDRRACNFLYTPDIGDAPDPPYPSIVHNGAGRVLNGVPLTAPDDGAEHIFGTKGHGDPDDDYLYEWLGGDVSGECESNQIDRDPRDDGVRIRYFPIMPFPLGLFFQGWLVFDVTVSTDQDAVGDSHDYDTHHLYLNIWVDWNGDGTWDDPGEHVVGPGDIVDPDHVGEPKVFSRAVLIPESGTGKWWIRVRLDWGEDCGAENGIDTMLAGPRYAAQFGEVEDYYVGISHLYIPNTDTCVNPGDYVTLPILLHNNTTPFGGFELEVEFDYTSMTFVGAEPGELIEGFEKFTYRLLPCPSCGCCKYKILLYGQYDMPNGVENIGDPIPMNAPGVYQTLVNLNFVVNNDENLRGLKLVNCWEWEGTVVNDTLVEDWECSENTFSSWSGDTLYTSALLCQFNPDICDDPTDRIQPILIFQYGVCGQNCGGVDICPAGPGFCKRGDINMNDMTHEVADAVLFASYFVEGTSVFRYDEAYQICATDVNADGRTLTLSDLVYLIRVILRDAVAIPKLTPSDEVANVIVYNGTISTECAAPIGAILFEFDGAVSPTLLADMEMVNKDNKVLVWSSKGKSFSTGQVLTFEGEAELVTATAVDRDSRELNTTITAKVAPAAFALHPAYPNPFNPFVNLSFNLPEATSYSLKIYNVTGQLVRAYENVGSVGLNVINWDSKDNAGVEVASGVYFYKLTAGRFSATEKMVLMK